MPPAQFDAWLADQKTQLAEPTPPRGRAREAGPQTGAGGREPVASKEQQHSRWPLRTSPVPQMIADRVERPPRGWTSWLTTTDHKRIGILYMVTTFVFFFLGGVEALMMRLQLGAPNNNLVTPEVYNQLFTMHGTTMIFLFVVPMMAGFGNYFVPLMIGARDMAFPRLNALSYWLLLAGGIVFYASLFFNPPEAGWTSYVPLVAHELLAERRPGRLDLPRSTSPACPRSSARSTSSRRSPTCARRA